MKQKIKNNTPDTRVLAANHQNRLTELVSMVLYSNLLTAFCIFLLILTNPTGQGWQWGLGMSMFTIYFKDQFIGEYDFSGVIFVQPVLCPNSTHQLLKNHWAVGSDRQTMRGGSGWSPFLSNITVPKTNALTPIGNQE